jgi:AcrR family transcriptional regulator
MTANVRRLLDVVAATLVADPSASLADIATAAGVSRTTIHNRYPTRQDLLVALALDGMGLVEVACEEARLEEGDPVEALERLVVALLPLGSRLEFLLRERSLDGVAEVEQRYAVLDAPLVALIERMRAAGLVCAGLPTWWVVEAAFGTVYAAWAAIADGRLARRDAPDLVCRTILRGCRP